MKRLAQLWRMTTVRLTAMFIALFLLFSIVLLGYTAFQASFAIQQNQAKQIQREIALLQRVAANRGLRDLAITVQQLAQRPGPGVYYLADASGLKIVGNIEEVPANVLASNRIETITYDRNTDFSRDQGEGEPEEGGTAYVRTIKFDSGFRLVVGRDVTERRNFTAILFGGLGLGLLGIVALSALAGGLTANRVLRRIDAINQTSRNIMAGNLSERIPITNRNDEFDALASELNKMLARIEQLMQGLKEVTDNVAHDLKTPLTRLRNSAEAALRDGQSGDNQRAALEKTIEESDRLIRTFNALLLIARIEAGTPSGTFAPLDVSEILSDLEELYQPLAEERQIALSIEQSDMPQISANKELLFQALVNLIENAFKYAALKPQDGQEDIEQQYGGEPLQVQLRLSASKDLAHIDVCDNGIGVPEAERQRVMERFVRLEKSRTDDGAGLGLSLVAAVANLHSGSFELLDNAPGLCARLSIPLQKAPQR